MLLRAQGEDVFPIPGTKRMKYLEVCAAFHCWSEPYKNGSECEATQGCALLELGWSVLRSPRRMRLPSP